MSSNRTLRELDYIVFLRLAPVVLACDGDVEKEKSVLQGNKYNWIDWRAREYYLSEMFRNEVITRGRTFDE